MSADADADRVRSLPLASVSPYSINKRHFSLPCSRYDLITFQNRDSAPAGSYMIQSSGASCSEIVTTYKFMQSTHSEHRSTSTRVACCVLYILMHSLFMVKTENDVLHRFKYCTRMTESIYLCW